MVPHWRAGIAAGGFALRAMAGAYGAGDWPPELLKIVND
jgi:hypothetical protein